MSRLRVALAFSALLIILSLSASAFAGEEPVRDAPAVTVTDPAGVEEDPAWTFRFLVPTLLAMGVLGVAATAIGYSRRVKGRYRVAR